MWNTHHAHLLHVIITQLHAELLGVHILPRNGKGARKNRCHMDVLANSREAAKQNQVIGKYSR